MMNDVNVNDDELSFRGVIMLGLDLDDFLEFWLIEIPSGVLQDVLGLLLQDFEEEHRDHILQLWVLSQIGLIVHPILHFLLIQQSHLCWSKAFHTCHVVSIVVLFFVVHVRYLVIIHLLLLLLAHYLQLKSNIIINTVQIHPTSDTIIAYYHISQP